MTTNSPTDTNQASEDELREKINSALFADDFPILNDIEKDAVDRILAIIRTEKLKLLDRLSSHQEDLFWWTGGEYDELEGIDMRAIAAERELLTKLEAEL